MNFRILLPLLLPLALHAGSVKIELPAETPQLKPGAGVELVTAQCVICHSVDYLSTQPQMPRAFWQASVTKMQQKFGAPIAAADIEAVVDYLAKNYGAPAAPK